MFRLRFQLRRWLSTVSTLPLGQGQGLVSLGDSVNSLMARAEGSTVLTPNEMEFLARLEAAALELRFFPQVAMGALLDPAVSRSDGKAYFRLRGMFAQKFVDLVAQPRSDGAIVAIIELDDRTHDSEKDAKREGMLKSAGYRIVRWHSKTKPDAATIRAALVSEVPTDMIATRPAKAAGARASGSPS